jgi:PPOX class probable F420-dependent enzyme
MMFDSADTARLEQAANIWLATVRADNSPHLVPIWFVWLDNKAYLCTARQSVKARNIAANARVALALEDGSDPLVFEGAAQILQDAPDAVVAAFLNKYDWDIRGDSTYDVVVEITPQRVVL